MRNKEAIANRLVDLMTQRCKPCEGGTAALTAEQIAERIAVLEGWQVVNGELTKTYAFGHCLSRALG